MATLAPPSPLHLPDLLPAGALWLPSADLSACVRGIMVRHTTGSCLLAHQRVNHYPSTPLCSLTWWFSGTAEQLLCLPTQATHGDGHTAVWDGPRMPATSSWLWSGPLPEPTSTHNPGPVHVMTVMLMPDAMTALTGIRPAEWVGRFADAAEVLPPDWLELRDAVAQAPTDAQRMQALEAFLTPRWQSCRPAASALIQQYADWSDHLAQRAALAARGSSLRQWERRIKQWTGLSMRGLKGFARGEALFFQSIAAYLRDGEVDWAELALELGYADQSHMCRETRRYTGFSPEQLRKGVLTRESFWPYRLWV